jgi:excisionase family DNA binding protein
MWTNTQLFGFFGMDHTDSPDDLLSTGEVARMLGTTSRHVAHLADRGELPYTLAGTHRRIRRGDAERLAALRAPAGGGPMTKDQRQSLWLGYLVAARLVQDPERVLSDGKRTAERYVTSGASGAPWLRQWIALIDEGPDAVLAALVSTSPHARELRQNSPFASALDRDERIRAIKAFHRAHGKAIGRSTP